MRVYKWDNFIKKENMMVVKKKMLYLGLLVSLLGVGNVIQAYKRAMLYTLTIKNNTLYAVEYTVSTVPSSSCRVHTGSFNGVINSGGESLMTYGGIVGCSVQKVEAKVYYGDKVIKAKPYTSRRGGTMTLIIEGSSGPQEEPRYRVVKKRVYRVLR